MAYAALVSLAEILEQLRRRDDSPLESLESLQENVGFLQGFLNKNPQKFGETIQSVEAQIRDAAYQTQDILEYHIPSRTRIQRKHEQDLLEALELVDSAAKEAMNFQRSCRVEEEEEETQIIAPPASSSSAPNGKNTMVGFDEDLKGIKGHLCGESSKLEIISIVGMGGIGKTTLAINIFDDLLFVHHFDIRAWATISQDYHFRGILLSILRSFTLKTDDVLKRIRKSYLAKTTDEKLVQYVYKSLKGRRFLIILDDMWSSEAWDGLRRSFPDDDNGSRVVITTRLADVAEYASSSPLHQMHFLDENQSWTLLQEKVFDEQSCPPELGEIGRIIAKNCGGLPLAISVVAGILKRGDMTQFHWQRIAQNTSSAVAATDDEHFLKILTLSYDHLPHHLKPCFLYMGCFSEDYRIPIAHLTSLWVAEGFLEATGSNKSLEETAEEYLEDLVKRNLILSSERRSNGGIRFCGVHDLLRDLCMQKAQEEKFIDLYTNGRDITNQRRLSIRPHIYVERVIRSNGPWPVRSVLHFGTSWKVFAFVSGLRLLRVLVAPNTSLDSFPVEITDLFHLRYLCFAYYCMKGKPMLIPAAISKLGNLQTLIIHLHSSDSRLNLPFQIWKIPKLRHLILLRASCRIPLCARVGGVRPSAFAVLENLHTLCGVSNFEFTSKVLHLIRNLKKLKLSCSVVCRAKWWKLRLNNLVHLHQLETLSLRLGKAAYPWRGESSFIAGYALPPNLKKLTLVGCRPPSDDMSILGSLPNLEVLKLKDFDVAGGVWESKQGEFPRLRFMLIEDSNLVCWRAESDHFSCLEQLIIRRCRQLEEIPREIGDVATLQLIEVDGCSDSAADSARLIQEDQESMGNDILRVLVHQR